MNELMKSVLILSRAPLAHKAIDRAFKDRGFEPVGLDINSCENEKLPERPPSAILLITDNVNEQANIKTALIKARYAGINVPVLALTSSQVSTDFEFDSILLKPCHPAQIVLRTIGLIRLAHMEQEIGLRLETLEHDFGIAHERPKNNDNEPFKILFVGKATPEFMIVINALQRKNVRVVAAFTSFTAFDYLYEQTFDAVVMNGLTSLDSALSVTQTMRKNAKLYHVPALLLTKDIRKRDQDAVYDAGMNDILDAQANLEDISARVLEQANFHRMHETLKHEFGMLGGDTCTDTVTRLYNKSFFNAHLARVFKFYDSQDVPVSLCLIRIAPQDSNKTDDAIAASYQQIGIMIKNLVRLQDITARLEPNLFAISFPGQTAGQLGPVIERIESILKCATLSDPLTGAVLKIKLELTMTTLNSKNVTSSAA
jgi:two-component system, cell cycle response regulator PopA